MSEPSDAARSPLRREVRVSRVAQGGETLRIEADEHERAAVASFLDLVAVERLSCVLTLSPFGRGGMAIRGRIEAELVQESVVSLAPVRQSVREEIARTFLPDGSALLRPALDEAGEMAIDPDGEDPPDPFTGDTVDVGAAVVESVALALDPYPREGNEAFKDQRADAAAAEHKVSPFAALAALREKGTPR